MMTPSLPVFRLDGQRALVTGGSKGIGRATAFALAAAGAEVVIAARDPAALARTAAEIGGACTPLVLDVADVDSIRVALAEAGPFDLLVNNAGSVSRQSFLDAEESEIDRLLALNVKGAMLVAQAVARGMVASGRRGAIVNISSVAGLRGTRMRSLYSATKHAVEGLTKTMALELAPHGIRVNAVNPSFVATPLTEDLVADPQLVAQMAARIPLGRILQPEDIAGPVLFLLSPAAGMVSGISLPVDGGSLAG